MMEVAQSENVPYTLLSQPEEPSRKNYCRYFLNGFTSIVSAPERGLEWVVQKIADIGSTKGIGLRGAKLTLAVTSLTVFGESVFQYSWLQNNPNRVGSLCLFPGRSIYIICSLIPALMCLPLGSRLAVLPSGNRLDGTIIRNPKLMLRIAEAITLFTCCFWIPLIANINSGPLSSSQISYLVADGLINVPVLLLTAGMSKLIQSQYPALASVPPFIPAFE